MIKMRITSLLSIALTAALNRGSGHIRNELIFIKKLSFR